MVGKQILEAAEARVGDYLASLEEMVNIDSGSFSPEGVNRVADILERRAWDGGWQVERVPHAPAEGEEPLGDLLVCRLPDGDGPRVLMIGHTDTVFDDGTVSQRPFRVEGNRAYGPGVTDMKDGVLAGFMAVEILQAMGLSVGNVTFVCNPDEEIGSPFSGPVIKELAGVADVALVLESAREDGAVVSRRKGVTDYTITLTGRAAHAGVEPERGRSAVLEAARLTTALHDLNGRWPGVTVNVGVLEGGTRPNIVAESARMHVDVRSPEASTLAEVEAEIERLAANPADPDVTIEASGMKWHRPMEISEGSERLLEMMSEVAEEIGFTLVHSETGGASDACTTASVGVPTVDGLGPTGGNAHASSEYLEVEAVAPRVALLAGTLHRLSRGEAV
jgi:glutamate carboxypeptidase